MSLAVTFSGILLGIVGFAGFIIILGGIPVLVSKLFNVTVVNRSGTVLAKPHYTTDISGDISNSLKSTLKKIKNLSKTDFSTLSNPVGNKIDKLEKLSELKNNQIITHEEFESLKSEILNG
ncbi:SHOCT domain-containing protein [Tenacibaculum finnmarkense]|uniref:SHOCT domain-containing protein n=1 Tax=Tenacibaculum finnmarkense TaxID=2781243 RepID=UPI001E5515A1|nr:SHOCT domain-containing protein [Tenacibaculum finnmarkense]MCD8427897.1 SHOCT domain-containing protein [Tenacibaculum finnmarkense genomovar finnmarkense]